MTSESQPLLPTATAAATSATETAAATAAATRSTRYWRIIVVFGVIFALSALWFLSFDRALPNDPLDAALEILGRHPAIDTHIDVPDFVRLTFRNNASAIHLDEPTPGHVDIPRLRAGRVGAFFWSLFTNCPTDPGDDFTRPTAAARYACTLLLSKLPCSLHDHHIATHSSR